MGGLKNLHLFGVHRSVGRATPATFLAALAVWRQERAAWSEATGVANAAGALSVASAGLFLPGRDVVDRAAGSRGGLAATVRRSIGVIVGLR